MKNIIIILIGIFISFSAVAQCTPPAVLNACSSGVDATLGLLDVTTSGSISGLATASSVSFTAVAGGVYTFDICGNPGGTSSDSQLTILDAGTCAPASTATQVTDNYDDDGCIPWSSVSFTAIAAGTYVVYITEYFCDSATSLGTVTMDYAVTIPVPPPSCGVGNPAPANACASAPTITNLDGFCGTTSASYTPDGTFSGCASSYSIDNNSWLKFTAALEEVVINYWITGGASCSSGIQLAVVTGTCGSTMTSVACASNPTGGIGSSGVFNITGLTPGQDYYIMIDGYAGDVCDYTFGVESGVALSCGDCIVDACATNPVQTDFPTSEVNFGGNCWDAISANTASGDIVTADAAGTITVCTDFDASAYPDFIGFDNCISYFDDNGSGDFDSGAFVTSATIYQEVAGSCVALVPTSYNIYGQPEFDNNATAGTTPGDVGSFDPTIPITFCYTYTSDGSGVANDDDVSGNTAVAYGCTQVTSVVAGTQTACNPVDNTYTQQITVTLANDPTGLTGDDVVVINGQTFTVTSNPQTFTLTGLTADGADVDVTTYMEVSSGCERLDAALFTAPAACAAVCPVVDYTTPAAVCSGDAVDFTVGAGCTGFTGSGTTGTYIDLYYYYDGTTTEAPTGYENVALPFGSTYPDPFNDGNLTPFVSDGLCLNQQDSGWTNSGCSSFIASYFAFVFDYNTDADGDGFGDYICNVYRYDVTIYPAQPSAVVTNNTACGQPTVKLVAADGTTECIADAAFGTAATAACGTGNTTVNSNGTFTAAQIATALSGDVACYIDEPYTGSSSCPNVAPAVADAGSDVNTTCTDPVALGATGIGMWSGGAGTFSDATSPTSTYTPTSGEAGTTVILTWTVMGTSPCPNATDMANVTVAACPACPDLSAAAPAAQVMNSTCSTVGGTPSGGSISAPATVCPSGSSLEYSLDNTNWSATIPTYDQDGPAQTVYTRCLCGLDGVTASPTSQVTTVPGTCPMPSFTFTIIDPCTCNNDQPADDAVLNGVGSFSETVMLDTGAGVAGAGLSIYVSAIGANMGATAPTGIAVNNLLTDNGDGTYSISFTHYDGTGYTIEVSWDQDNDDNPGTGHQLVVGVDGNRCGYPSANITAMGPYDNCAGQADVPLAATIVDGGGVGSSAWSGTGVSGTNFNPSGLTAGTATINLNYTGVDNGHVSPDNGATVVYPGCTATSSENVTINACTPACNADNGTWN